MSESSKLKSPESQSSTDSFKLGKPWCHDLIDFKKFMCHSSLAIFDIAATAEDVFIDEEEIKEQAILMIRYMSTHIAADNYKHLKSEAFRFSAEWRDWGDDFFDNKNIFDWLFIMNALNFSLWNSQYEKQWTIAGLTGYKALYLALKRAIEERRPIWDPNYYTELSQSECEIIFGGDKKTNIPLIKERVRTLREIGRVLLDKYEGTFANCIKICEGDQLRLMHLLYNDFESYRDTVNYKGKEVFIGCKAATLISDLNCLDKVFKNSDYRFRISTIFADYCAPRSLINLKILRYSNNLQARFTETVEPLEHGSREDMELRCCSLVACKTWCQEIIKCSMQREEYRSLIDLNTHRSIVPIVIESFLWNHRYSMDHPRLRNTIPFHNIRSLYY